jgi:hypothetical protein
MLKIYLMQNDENSRLIAEVQTDKSPAMNDRISIHTATEGETYRVVKVFHHINVPEGTMNTHLYVKPEGKW